MRAQVDRNRHVFVSAPSPDLVHVALQTKWAYYEKLGIVIYPMASATYLSILHNPDEVEDGVDCSED